MKEFVIDNLEKNSNKDNLENANSEIILSFLTSKIEALIFEVNQEIQEDENISTKEEKQKLISENENILKLNDFYLMVEKVNELAKKFDKEIIILNNEENFALEYKTMINLNNQIKNFKNEITDKIENHKAKEEDWNKLNDLENKFNSVFQKNGKTL